ncbi:hypothetical protein GE061_004025 [Apolygus lucorum]|uniref:Uncharacterized protein n=1 Tax=Apolygus lucorum TaxID=248454 RepID=A0A8S9WY15_APOLU|nr:hypothetical protein GE061_004025 [Apolygus lucorum]
MVSRRKPITDSRHLNTAFNPPKEIKAAPPSRFLLHKPTQPAREPTARKEMPRTCDAHMPMHYGTTKIIRRKPTTLKAFTTAECTTVKRGISPRKPIEWKVSNLSNSLNQLSTG